MRRSLVPCALIIVALAGVAPSRAEVVSALVASGGRFLPGDKDLVGQGGLPTAGIEVTHVRGTNSEMQFTNADTVPHTVTGSLMLPVTSPPAYRFGDTTLRQPGDSISVRGVKSLPLGRYTFTCKVHSSMTGTLNVIASPV